VQERADDLGVEGGQDSGTLQVANGPAGGVRGQVDHVVQLIYFLGEGLDGGFVVDVDDRYWAMRARP